MLRLQNISKNFPGVKALQNISLAFTGGTVHAVCGENGAGKSTLMNIIAGNLKPDSGDIFWKDQRIQIDNIQQAQKLGISIVYQEGSLVDSLSVAENIFPVDKPLTPLGLIDFSALYEKSEILLNQLQLTNISSKTVVGKLQPPQKRMVEIAKALAQNPSLLILDEPTASITLKETLTLFNIIRKLKEEGVAIIYISHRMAEIKMVADMVTVLKDGCFRGTVDAQTPSEELIRMMVGREFLSVQHTSDKTEEVKLEVKDLSGEGFEHVNFHLHKGEILGFAGLLGSGRTELARALFGDTHVKEGEIIKDGQSLTFRHPVDAIRAGIVYIPDDRKSAGLFIEKTVSDNIISSKLGSGYYNERHNADIAEQFKVQLAIKTPTVKQIVRKLSGGNQQKVVVAKWLNMNPDVLVVNEPTHGIDIGAKADMYEILKSLTRKGKSIIIISSELPELLTIADRIAVMYAGKIQKTFDRNEATEEKIMEVASGIIR